MPLKPREAPARAQPVDPALRTRMITTRVHGIIDYLVGLLLLALPYLLGFADGGAAQKVTLTLGAVAVLYSLLTNYELGVLRLIPFRLHLGIDVVFALLTAASPWLFGFSERIWWPHLLIGLAGLAVVFASRSTPLSAGQAA